MTVEGADATPEGPHAAVGTGVSVDVVVLTLADPDGGRPAGEGPRPALHVRVVEDGLPGSALQPGEDLEEAAARVMAGAGLTDPRHVEQLASFGSPTRTPPPRTVSVTYLALVPAPFDGPAGRWVAADGVAGLACDHDAIVAAAVQRVRSKLAYSTIAYGLLPDEFTLSELQDVYEAVLATSLDKRNFRKKVQALGLVEETGGLRRGQHRPAALHRFTSAGLVLLDEGPLV